MKKKLTKLIDDIPSVMTLVFVIAIFVVAIVFKAPWASFMIIFVIINRIDEERSRRDNRELAHKVIEEAILAKMEHPASYPTHYERATAALDNHRANDLARYLPPV